MQHAEASNNVYMEMDDNFLPRFIGLCAAINEHYNRNILSHDITSEITHIYHAVRENNWISNHTIPESVNLSLVNQNKNGRTPLITLLLQNADFYHSSNPFIIKMKKLFLRKIKELLLKGHNPNELGESGDSPLRVAITFYDSKEIIELFLWYGANPFTRYRDDRYGTYCSAIETAKAYNKPNFLAAIDSALTKIEKPLQKAQELKVTNINMHCHNETIMTQFQFSNEKIIATHFSQLDKLTQEQRAAVFSHFKSIFEVPNNSDPNIISSIFDDDFSGSKLIELIYDNKKIVGFNLYELIFPEKRKDSIFLHCIYSFIDSAYRGYGLMMLLIFKPAYSLQLLQRDKHIGIFYSSVHYNSYRLANFLHYPKHQPEYMNDLVKEILDTIFENNYTSYHDLITYYIVDELRVKSPAINPANVDLNQKYYHKEILGLGEDFHDKIHTRAAPVLFYVGDENYFKMQQASNRLNINFTALTVKFAEYLLTHFVNLLDARLQFNPINISGLKKSSRFLFWDDKILPSCIERPVHQQSLSKL
jgi:hypothetical protein